MKITNLILQESATLRELIQTIDRGEQGVCIVLHGTRFVGMMTDGDVRRSLLRGADLNDLITTLIQKNCFTLPIDATYEAIQSGFKKYKFIPIISPAGDFVNLATPSQYHTIPLVQPIFDGNELEYVTDCIRTGWISSQGKYVRQFEGLFGEYVGCSNCLAVSNGTVALHLALATLGIGPGDEVIVPNLTFAAPVNAILYVGATPVLVDVDAKNMTMNPEEVKKAISTRTKAIIPVHLYGYPADMRKLMSLAKEFNLLVIEDCAEALGTKFNDVHVGNFGDAAIFSFFGNKTITTGEGGMLLFKDVSNLNRAKILRDHGMSPYKRYWHDEVGYNYRITNVQAAIGLAQLEKVKFFVERKRWIAREYEKRLSGASCLLLPTEDLGITNSYWLYTIVLLGDMASKRDEIIEGLKLRGIESRPIFFPVHEMPPYQKYALADECYSVSVGLSKAGISLPSSVYVTEEEIQRVCSALLTLAER
jgi:perosamine synthetase